MLISQQLATVSNQNLAKPAIRYLGKDITYSILRKDINRLSYLYQNEIGHKARVAFIARNCPAYISTFFALTNIRAVTIPVNPNASPELMLAWLKDAKATHVAVTADLANNVKDMLRQAHLELPVIEIEKKHGGEYDTTYTPPPDNAPIEKDIVLMLRTGGTSGPAKFCCFNHTQLHHAAMCLRGVYHPLGTDRFFSTMSWFHPFAYVHSMLFPLMTGTCTVIEHGVSGLELLDYLVQSRVTRIIDTPAFFNKLYLTLQAEQRASLPGTKSITVGTGFLSSELKLRYQTMNVQICHCYGQTENLWTIAMQDSAPPEKGEERPTDRRHVGKGLAGLKYKVIDENGDEIPGEEPRIGPFCVTGPTIMTSYFEKEMDTKQVLRGTWLYTHDIAKLEGIGETLQVTFLGRKADVLLRDGKAVNFERIEEYLKRIPGIEDAAAFQYMTVKKEPIIACAVVRIAGKQILEKHVLDACKQGLPGVANALPDALTPQLVVFTDAIPRDYGGNAAHQRLRAICPSI